MRPAALQRRPAIGAVFTAFFISLGVPAVQANQPMTDPAPGPNTEEGFAQAHDRAVSAFLKGDLEEALRGFNRAIAIDPKIALAYYNRGNVRFGLKDYPGAISDYSEAITLQRDFALAFMNRGSAYSSLWRLDEALADLDDAVRLEPKLSDAFYNRAIVLIKRGDLSKAMQDYERLLELDRSTTDSRAGARLKLLMERQDSDYVPDDPARLTSELAHGRKTEYLLSLLERSCLAAGHDAAALARVAREESWTPVPAAHLKKEPGGDTLIAGWSHRFLESVYYVIQSMPENGRQTVCSVSAMPVSEHMLQDFKGSLQDRFRTTHAADINTQDRVETRYSISMSQSSQPQDLQVVHRKSVRFVTLRAIFPRP